MNVNVAVDGSLVENAVRLGNHRSEREAATAAVAGYVARLKQLHITDLFGAIDCDPHYDYKADRSR